MPSDAIIEEGKRLVDLAEKQGIRVRLLGGVGVRLRCPDIVLPELERDYKDLDFATQKGQSRKVRDLLVGEGYDPDTHFNALHGDRRLLFYDEPHERQVDVFVGTFHMCHTLDLDPRVRMDGPALPPSDLLLLKLQIVELNHKDILDTLRLLLHYEPKQDDGSDVLSAGYVARICAGDWGWYTTLHDNLATIRTHAADALRSPEDTDRVQERIDLLFGAMERADKSLGWRMRDKVGRRKQWYDIPEEVGTN